MKEKIPGFYFYPADWLACPDVRGMTDQQYRVYHTLLCTAWLSNPPATLPNTDEELARLAAVPLETWNAIKGPIVAKFDTNGNDRLFNPKMTKVYKDARQKYEAAAQRWSKNKKKTARK